MLCLLQARQEAAARAVLEAAKKAGAAGELLSAKELQAVAQAALNPPKEAPAPARVGLTNAPIEVLLCQAVCRWAGPCLQRLAASLVGALLTSHPLITLVSSCC